MAITRLNRYSLPTTLDLSAKTLTLPSASVTAHVTQTDLTPVRQDVLTLALKQAVQENSTKFNLPNSAITKFEADADYDSSGSTTINRHASEYLWSAAQTINSATTTTAYGTAARSSTHSKFGGYSLDTSGNAGSTNTSYLKTGTLTSITNSIGTGDWTIDFWFKYTQRDGSDRMFSIGDVGNATEPVMSMGYNTDTQMNFYHNGSNTDVTYPTLDTDWHHYAMHKDGSALHHWHDGVHKGSFTWSTNLMSGNDLYIGRRHNNASEFTAGYFDEFRVSKAPLRYTSSQNFTPPTSAYTTDASTVLLFPFDDTGLDDHSDTSIAQSATGTALGTTNVPTSAVTEVSGVLLLKNSSGTNTLGTDVKVYFTANNSAWTEAASYADAGTFSTGIKMIKLGKTTVTSGSDVRWKVVYANQSAGSKVAHIYGMGVNY